MPSIPYEPESWIFLVLVAAGAVVFVVDYVRRPLGRILDMRVEERMRAIQESQHRIFADLSHNLQTPLAILRAKAERLEQQTLRDGETMGLKESVDAVAGCVNELLAFSRLEEALKVEEKRVFPLHNLVQNLCEEASVVAEAEDIQLTCDVREASILGNERHLKEAVANLIVNAIKYMGSGPIRKIRVSLEIKGGQALLTVTDTGMGISEHELPRIFDRFYRGSNRAYGQVAGTGLGLAIVERIVKEHGGAITVTSELGKGSAFTLALPQARQPRLRKNLSSR